MSVFGGNEQIGAQHIEIGARIDQLLAGLGQAH